MNLVYHSKRSVSMPKRAEQNLIVCIGKSEAEVTVKDCPRTVEAIYRWAQSIVQPLCDSRATCMQ